MTPFDPRLPLIAAQAKVKTCHVFHCWSAIKEMGRQFHIGAFAAFAGLEERHVAAIMEALAANCAMPATRAAPAKQGTRLPLDWALEDELAEWAMFKRRWSANDVALEAEKFANYWHGLSGSKAIKADWAATWRNWVLNSTRPDGVFTPQGATQINQREALEARAALYDKMGRTQEAAEIRRKLPDVANIIPFNPPLMKSVNK